MTATEGPSAPDPQSAGEASDGPPTDSTDLPDLDHLDDGRDLARSITRSTAGSTPPAKRRPVSGKRRWTTSRVSGSHPDDRGPQLLDSTLGRLVGERGWGMDLKVQGVFARWAELVGEEVASHSTPETLTEGQLVVRTDSTAWATQLRLLAPSIVKRLCTELGDGTVVRIEVLGPHLPTWKKGPRSVRDGRGPRDTYG